MGSPFRIYEIGIVGLFLSKCCPTGRILHFQPPRLCENFPFWEHSGNLPAQNHFPPFIPPLQGGCCLWLLSTNMLSLWGRFGVSPVCQHWIFTPKAA